MKFHSQKHAGAENFALFYEAINLASKLKPAAACKLLDIKPATLKRYLNGTSEPPAAMVRLLFMESFYGVDAITSHSYNGEIYARQQSRGLQEQLAVVAGHILDLEKENAELRAAVAAGSCSRDFAANSSRFSSR